MSTEKFNDQGSNPNSGFGGTPQQPDELGIPLTIVSFCIPLVGLILFFVNREKFPQKARTAGIAAAVGIGIGLVSRVIVTVAMG